MKTRAQEIQDEIKKLEDEWEVEVTTFIRLDNKPQKIVKAGTLPRGKRIIRNKAMLLVDPVRVIVVEERDAS